VPCFHCIQSTQVSVMLTGQVFSLRQTEISFHFVMVESNFGVGIGKTIHFVLWCSLWFPHKNDVPRLIFTPFVGDHALAMLLVSIYVML